MKLLYADSHGNFYDHPTLQAVGRSDDKFIELEQGDLVELPAGSSLVMIPGGLPVGVSEGGFRVCREAGGIKGPVYAVGALLPQGYTRTFWPAFRRPGTDRPLPLFGYAAVAWYRGKVYAAAIQTDEPQRWSPVYYNTPELPVLVQKMTAEMPENRIVQHLARCALEYRCFTAQNIFYSRWEGGIPVSQACNAGCLGCISLQPAECCPSPQSRIDFIPTVEEVAKLGVRHLERAEKAIISFGQGCEGEPSLEAPLIQQAIQTMRRKTDLGTININTNAGKTENIKNICRAGLNTIRVSLISAREEVYHAYHQPKGYTLDNVRDSIKQAVDMGVYTSLNLLVSPGLTDREEEVEALLGFIESTGVHLIQLRNLNMDPDLLFARMPSAQSGIIGIDGLLGALKTLPGLELGNFSKALSGN